MANGEIKSAVNFSGEAIDRLYGSYFSSISRGFSPPGTEELLTQLMVERRRALQEFHLRQP
jgi:hypothetical protein